MGRPTVVPTGTRIHYRIFLYTGKKTEDADKNPAYLIRRTPKKGDQSALLLAISTSTTATNTLTQSFIISGGM
jgi:hypothetical protein